MTKEEKIKNLISKMREAGFTHVQGRYSDKFGEEMIIVSGGTKRGWKMLVSFFRSINMKSYASKHMYSSYDKGETLVATYLNGDLVLRGVPIEAFRKS